MPVPVDMTTLVSCHGASVPCQPGHLSVARPTPGAPCNKWSAGERLRRQLSGDDPSASRRVQRLVRRGMPTLERRGHRDRRLFSLTVSARPG